jgi:hypothetical protein
MYRLHQWDLIVTPAIIERGNTVTTFQHSLRINTTRLLVLTVFGISALSFSAAPTWAAATPADTKEAHQDWAKQRQEWFKHAMDRMADRLEIKASQQNAWQAYTKVLDAAMTPPARNAETKSDAASITRLHADMAAMRAQKLAQVADATAKFQEVLGPEQRQTFDQIVAHFAHRHAHRFHGDHHGEADGHEHEGWGHHEHGSDSGQNHEHEHDHQHD